MMPQLQMGQPLAQRSIVQLVIPGRSHPGHGCVRGRHGRTARRRFYRSGGFKGARWYNDWKFYGFVQMLKYPCLRLITWRKAET